MELMNCPNLAVPNDVMHHVVRVESSYNPYAIGVVGGRLARQPRNLAEALSTVRMLEREGYNFSVGLAQVNRHNLGKYGLDSYKRAFEACPNLTAGSRILAECYGRSGRDWGKSFSCYYSGNFTTGFRHGYVQKIFASMHRSAGTTADGAAIAVVANPARSPSIRSRLRRSASSRTAQRIQSSVPAQVQQMPILANGAASQDGGRISGPADPSPGEQSTAMTSRATPAPDNAFVF